MKQIKATEEEVFTNLFATIYQLSAEDQLALLSSQIKDAEIIKTARQNIKGIHNKDDYEQFLSTLPSKTDILNAVKEEIKGDFSQLEIKLNEIEEKRKLELENPTTDEKDINNAFSKLAKRIDINLDQIPNIDFTDLDTYRTQLVTKVYESISTPIRADLKLGDILEITGFEGFDFDDPLEEVYYYGGNEEDYSLGTEGELIASPTEEKYVLIFENTLWNFHPDELKQTGKNRFYDTLTTTGETDLRKGIENLILELSIDSAKNRINFDHDHEKKEVTKILKKKYSLSNHQLEDILADNNFDYEIPDFPDEVNIPYEKLIVLAVRSITHKANEKIDYKTENFNEEKLKEIVLEATRLALENNYDKAKEQMDTLSILLKKEYSVVFRKAEQTNELEDITGEILLKTVDSWINREKRDGGKLGVKFSFDRALLYHDRDIYTAEPFSPPSEELHRVLKLEVGNGCQYAKCTYCTEYGQARFHIKRFQAFQEHIAEVRKKLDGDLGNIQRLFLGGGDIFAMPTDKLLQYVDAARSTFDNQQYTPYNRNNIRRIAAFTRTEGIEKKSIKEMNTLYEHGLNMLFWGIETGSDQVLQYVNKNINYDRMEKAGKKAVQSKIQISTMIMTGLGGLKHYEDHVVQTAKLLNTVQPRFITFMSINAAPFSPYADIMAEEQARGENMPLSPEMTVEQMYDIVGLLDERLYINQKRCLVAAYRLPVERIAENPIQFRGRLEYSEKRNIQRTLSNYFYRRQPSPLIPDTSFNQDSPLRRKAEQIAAK